MPSNIYMSLVRSLEFQISQMNELDIDLESYLTTKSSEIFKKDLADHKAHYDNIPFAEMIELEKKENPSIWNSVEPDVQEEIIYLAANLDKVFR